MHEEAGIKRPTRARYCKICNEKKYNYSRILYNLDTS